MPMNNRCHITENSENIDLKISKSGNFYQLFSSQRDNDVASNRVYENFTWNLCLRFSLKKFYPKFNC